MFNASLYNDSLIGSGAGSRSWIAASAVKVVEAVGNLSVALTKAGKAAGVAAVHGSIKLTQYATQRISGVAESVGSAIGRVLVTSYAPPILESAVAVGRCRLSLSVSVPISGFASSECTLNPTIYRIIRMNPVVQVVGLNGQASGIDVYVGPTPFDRTVMISLIDRVVFISGPMGLAEI